MTEIQHKAYVHLPGLFQFYNLYRKFLPLYFEHREWFFDWCEIASIYGAPEDCLWGGGRPGGAFRDAEKVLRLVNGYGISARLTFSNSLLREKDLEDTYCNWLCGLFAQSKAENGVIVHSDLLAEHLRRLYPELYLVSSTTKVLTKEEELFGELNREDFRYVVPDFRFNKSFAMWEKMPLQKKAKVELLVNECCRVGCTDRRDCYETVSRQSLEEDVPDFVCRAPRHERGYRFSAAMENPMFISERDITQIYLPLGITNFKIEGRGLGSALVLEFLLYYLTKPEYRIHVREEMYLENTLDLF